MVPVQVADGLIANDDQADRGGLSDTGCGQGVLRCSPDPGVIYLVHEFVMNIGVELEFEHDAGPDEMIACLWLRYKSRDE
jgi:hypothetical protein